MRQVIDLYVGRQIEKLVEAKNTIIKLASKSKKSNIVGLERVAKNKEALPATGKLTRITSKRAERQNYFVEGTYDLQQVFRKRKKGSTEYYTKTYTDPKSHTEVFSASSKSEAIKMFEQHIIDEHTVKFSDGYDSNKCCNVRNMQINSVTVVSSYTSVNENDSVMKRAYPVKYDFIPADDKYLSHQGLRVIEQIDNVYGTLNKKT